MDQEMKENLRMRKADYELAEFVTRWIKENKLCFIEAGQLMALKVSDMLKSA
jgi:hypothetical protein